MTRKTANKHLSFFTKMWTSRVVPKALRPMSPFSGALYPKSEVRKDAVRCGRAEYTKAELERLFTSPVRSEEHTSELQSLMRISYAVFCLQKKNTMISLAH